MKIRVLLAALSVFLPAAAGAGQDAGNRARPAAPAGTASDKTAEAYNQFLLGHHLEEQTDEAGAIAAYKRAMELDPAAAEIPGELAGLYLRQNKIQEAMTTAEQALKLSPTNREANRVLGTIYMAMSEPSSDRETGRTRESGTAAERRNRGAGQPDRGTGAPGGSRRGAGAPGGSDRGAGAPGGSDDNTQNLTKAIHHLELAIEGLAGEADPNVRATLARAYVGHGDFGKAIPILSVLVNEQPQWHDGALLLAEAFSGAGRTREAVTWLEERAADDVRLLPTLAEFYERGRRWKDAADTYAKALQRAPHGTELRTRYASSLVNAGGRENLGKARDVLDELLTANPNDPRLLYLLSQAQRRLGDSKSAEATARKVIAQNAASAWGYYALAEALEERRAYQAVVDELSPLVAQNRDKPRDSFDVGILLPHLGFAYQELGQHDKAIATFEQARRLAPADPAVASYLVEANIAAKKYAAAIAVAQAALGDNPDDVRLLRLEAQALRQSGKADQGIALLEDALKKHGDDPTSYVALAQLYADAERGPQAVKLLQDAQTRFPDDNTVVFELGAVFDKQKRFADAERAFQAVIARDPDNAPALNYLGYMLAERGERLDESVTLLKKALTIEPDNGSYLDSLGWAYFKAQKLELAEDNLRRAADQLKSNSVVQDHYGELLFKLGRYDDAIAAWLRALSGDGDSIDRGEIDRKIRSAKQKINKK